MLRAREASREASRSRGQTRARGHGGTGVGGKLKPQPKWDVEFLHLERVCLLQCAVYSHSIRFLSARPHLLGAIAGNWGIHTSMHAQSVASLGVETGTQQRASHRTCSERRCVSAREFRAERNFQDHPPLFRARGLRPFVSLPVTSHSTVDPGGPSGTKAAFQHTKNVITSRQPHRGNRRRPRGPCAAREASRPEPSIATR